MTFLDKNTSANARLKKERKHLRGAMSWLNKLFYILATSIGKFIGLCCLKITRINFKDAELPGGYILAVTHLGNLEPAITSCILRRKIRWMARCEYFKPLWARVALRSVGGFPVNRNG